MPPASARQSSRPGIRIPGDLGLSSPRRALSGLSTRDQDQPIDPPWWAPHRSGGGGGEGAASTWQQLVRSAFFSRRSPIPGATCGGAGRNGGLDLTTDFG